MVRPCRFRLRVGGPGTPEVEECDIAWTCDEIDSVGVAAQLPVEDDLDHVFIVESALGDQPIVSGVLLCVEGSLTDQRGSDGKRCDRAFERCVRVNSVGDEERTCDTAPEVVGVRRIDRSGRHADAGGIHRHAGMICQIPQVAVTLPQINVNSDRAHMMRQIGRICETASARVSRRSCLCCSLWVDRLGVRCSNEISSSAGIDCSFVGHHEVHFESIAAISSKAKSSRKGHAAKAACRAWSHGDSSPPPRIDGTLGGN